MALDECHGNFPLTRIKAAAAGLPTADRVQEVWFRGVHFDVGGGLSVGLSSVSLCWMLRRAKENGLDIDQEKFDKYAAKCDADATISKNFDPKLDPARKLAQSDAVHESVRVRGTVGTTVHNDPFAGMTAVRG